jgi:hypothetical protein
MRFIIKLLCLALLLVFVIQPIIFHTDKGIGSFKNIIKGVYWWMSPQSQGW